MLIPTICSLMYDYFTLLNTVGKDRPQLRGFWCYRFICSFKGVSLRLKTQKGLKIQVNPRKENFKDLKGRVSWSRFWTIGRFFGISLASWMFLPPPPRCNKMLPSRFREVPVKRAQNIKSHIRFNSKTWFSGLSPTPDPAFPDNSTLNPDVRDNSTYPDEGLPDNSTDPDLDLPDNSSIPDRGPTDPGNVCMAWKKDLIVFLFKCVLSGKYRIWNFYDHIQRENDAIFVSPQYKPFIWRIR